jgi:hypothetical protein
MSFRLRRALAALVLTACAGCAGWGRGPALDLTPWSWTGSQAALGAWVIRYGYPDAPAKAQDPDAAAAPALDPVDAGMLRSDALGRDPRIRPGSSHATRFASFQYGCAREDRAEKSPCSVFLDFWLLEVEPPLADDTLPVYQERFEQVYVDTAVQPNGPAHEIKLDSHGRDWVHRAVRFPSGATFSHYSRPLDTQFALAVTSYTTRAPDRVVARDLARDAIDRIRVDRAP